MPHLAADLARIDFHHHFALDPGPVSEDDRRRFRIESGWPYPEDRTPWTPELSLRAMDELGIQVALLSMLGNPGGATSGRENREINRALNELAYSAVQSYPDRFGFFASVPVASGADATLAEVAYALDTLGADGVCFESSYGSGRDARYIGADFLDPVWAELDRRAAVVFVHGAQATSVNGFLNPFAPTSVTEVGNETFKAAADLVTRGKKRRYLNVRIILAHSGGSTPMLVSRVAVISNHLGSELSPDEIIEDFRTFYYETALSGFETDLVALENLVGLDRMLFGTDFPAVDSSMSAWTPIMSTRTSPTVDRPEALERVMRGNALTLLPRLRELIRGPVPGSDAAGQ
jgi:predicted TIM-barrel fold metal-dependent hydrolase